MINEQIKAILAQEGMAPFVTHGSEGPHLVATWQSFIELLDDRRLAFPAGGYKKTEANLAAGSRVQLLVAAQAGPELPKSAGYRLTGTAQLETAGEAFDLIKGRFPWCRAAVVMTVEQVEKIHG